MGKRYFVSIVSGLLLSLSAAASTFKVTTTADNVEGSLRWAVEQANAESELSTITFGLPAGSVVAPESTIDIKSSMIIDGKVEGGEIDICPSNSRCVLFNLEEVTLDSVVLQNLNIYESILETSTSTSWMNCLALIDKTKGHFILRNCHVSKFQNMVVSNSNEINLGNFNCVCEDMLQHFYKKGDDLDWLTLIIDGSNFINTKNIGYLHHGGSAGTTKKIEIKNSYAENIYSVSNGHADSIIYKKSTFVGLRNNAIRTGCRTCNAKIIVDSCTIINSKRTAFYSALDSADIIFTNNIVYGSGDFDLNCTRDNTSSHYSKIVIENNKFGNKDHDGKGIFIDASNSTVRNNTFCGIDGYNADNELDYRPITDVGSDTLLVEGNYFGIDGDVKSPNKKGDILLQAEYYLDSWKQNGYNYDFDLIPQITIKGNTFSHSNPEGIKMLDVERLDPTITENLFLETEGVAISNIKELSIPTITSITREKDDIIVLGNVASSAVIELFYTRGAKQTAEEYIDRVETDGDGNFKFIVPFDKLKDKEKICFTATATYPSRSTSNLSEVYCCDLCICVPETTIVEIADTILVGGEIYGQTFAEVGVFDQIYENLISKKGCDSVVSHRVVVKPTSLNYYVKTKRQNKGDGSDWDNAMNGEDFAKYLPLAPEGATFHIAAGTYNPIFDNGLNVPENKSDLCYVVNHDVTVIGGYPAGATTAENPSPDPENNVTLFTGKLSGNTTSEVNHMFEINNGLLNVKLDGVAIKNSQCGIYCSEDNKLNSITIDKVLFENNKTLASLYGDKGTMEFVYSKAYMNEDESNALFSIDGFYDVKIAKSKFIDNRGKKLFDYYNITKLNIESCEFNNNHTNESLLDFSELDNYRVSITIDSCLFEKNNALLLFGDMYKGSIKNSKIINNTLQSLNTGGSAYGVIYELCTIADNVCSNELISIDSYSNVSVKNCIINDNTTGRSLFKVCSPTITNNSIYNNVLKSNEDGVFPMLDYIVDMGGAQRLTAKIHNNTIVSNDYNGDLFYSSSSGNGGCEVYNNTILSNHCKNYIVNVEAGSRIDVSGNIMLFNKFEEPQTSPISINGNVNVNEYNATSDEDKFVPSVLDGTYDEATKVFTPALKDNGGFTPTVALKKDVLPDGSSIRFPRLENILKDQRGVDRLELTCMGAYEMNCSPVETELKDTVFVGDSYTFNGKNLDETCQKVGSYHFTATLTSAAGCDSVVKLSLAVCPLNNVLDYYVKTDGKGDGSDWINAMSPKDFAAYLPLVGDGVTFHIADGTYKSTYEDPELGRMYNINSSVTLIGSYPDTVKTVGVPPMPDVFTTTLTANASGTDYIFVYKDRPGDYSVSGFGTNDSILIRVNGNRNVSLYGITLSGVRQSNDYGAITMNDGGTLNLDRCAILKNNTSGVVASNTKVNVNATLAYQNVAMGGTVFRLNNSELNVTQSAFHENISDGEDTYAKGAVANLTYSKATFVNSTIANNWADMGGAFALSNSDISLTNNTFIGNLSINKDGENGSVFYSSDMISKVSLFGNLIVGNGAVPLYACTFNSEGYNIFSTEFKNLGVQSDMFMESKDYPYIIDGDVMQGNADIFIATVSDNGGYTPTVAMIESTFDGGEVISIPLDQRKVKMDQRDMLRKEKSCVGAYEYPTYKEYYVKQSPIGDGTGKDWNNAMGDTTFFRYFSAVPAGATFHVAAGTYYPLEDRYYHTDSYSYRRFYSCRPLNVYGGYPPKAELNAVADPSQYVTLLSADFNGDDVLEESDKDYSVMDYSNHKDNSSYVMTIISKVPGEVKLKGVTFSGNFTQFRGSSSALTVSSISPEVPISLKMDSCSFKKTYIGIYSTADTVIAHGCRFDSIYYLGMSHYPREVIPSVLEIENSSFTNLDEAFYVNASKGKVLLQNSTLCNARRLVEVTSISYTHEKVDLNLEMYHNTFAFSPKSYSGIEIPNYINTIAKGNIFNTNFSLAKDYDGENAIKPVVSDYNLFVENPDATKEVWTFGENDILVAPSDLMGALPGTMKDERFHAVSVLKSPENFTKVVALESDVVDHKIIRMPIEEGKVKVDQIATERLDMTCLGAYELRCDLLDLETVEIDTTKSTNDIIRDDQTKMYDNTCINGDLKVVFYIPGGCGTNSNGYARIVYKYSDSDELYVSDTIYPKKLANVDKYEMTIPYRETSAYIKYRIEVPGMKNGNSMTSPSSNGFWNVNSCDSMHSIINEPVFALCKEVGNVMSVFVKLGGDTLENGKLNLYYSETIQKETPTEFKNVEFVSPDGENYYAENIELSEETKFFNYYITYGRGDDVRSSLGNGDDNIIIVSVDDIDSICVDPCNNIRLSSHVLVEKNDTLSFDIYRKNTKVELFLCDENGVKLASKEYNNLPVKNTELYLISELSLRSKDLDLSYTRPYLLALKIDGKVSCMYVYLGRKPKVKPTEE